MKIKKLLVTLILIGCNSIIWSSENGRKNSVSFLKMSEPIELKQGFKPRKYNKEELQQYLALSDEEFIKIVEDHFKIPLYVEPATIKLDAAYVFDEQGNRQTSSNILQHELELILKRQEKTYGFNKQGMQKLFAYRCDSLETLQLFDQFLKRVESFISPVIQEQVHFNKSEAQDHYDKIRTILVGRLQKRQQHVQTVQNNIPSDIPIALKGLISVGSVAACGRLLYNSKIELDSKLKHALMAVTLASGTYSTVRTIKKILDNRENRKQCARTLTNLNRKKQDIESATMPILPDEPIVTELEKTAHEFFDASRTKYLQAEAQRLQFTDSAAQQPKDRSVVQQATVVLQTAGRVVALWWNTWTKP